MGRDKASPYVTHLLCPKGSFKVKLHISVSYLLKKIPDPYLVFDSLLHSIHKQEYFVKPLVF